MFIKKPEMLVLAYVEINMNLGEFILHYIYKHAHGHTNEMATE